MLTSDLKGTLESIQLRELTEEKTEVKIFI